jgi:signal transduction histidine kinase
LNAPTFGCLNFVITDDVQGMEPEKLTTGIGLRNIKGRLGIFNGKVHIDTGRGLGFTMNISIPL